MRTHPNGRPADHVSLAEAARLTCYTREGIRLRLEREGVPIIVAGSHRYVPLAAVELIAREREAQRRLAGRTTARLKSLTDRPLARKSVKSLDNVRRSR